MADLTAMMQAAAGAGGDANFIEDVFSTYLYTGNGSTQTITNGIDLAGEGGLVWSKSRSDAFSHGLYDTVRGATKEIKSDATTAQSTDNGVTAFNSDGYAVGARFTTNNSGSTYVSWTFRKQPKFFDVVTWSGNSTAGRSIPHNLGSVPGCIIIKSTNNVPDWHVWHRELTNPLKYLTLNNTDPAFSGSAFTAATPPDATSFNLTASGLVNQTGQTYVAYLFAHDAGGFGLSGEDNVISCGSFTTDGSANATVNLGYEPQWVLSKRVNIATNWQIVDTMRGFTEGTQPDPVLEPNTARAEQGDNWASITSTGFTGPFSSASQTYIYIAIRRGPMKVPETGTSVFAPVAYTGTSAVRSLTTNIVSDLAVYSQRTKDVEGLTTFASRLTSPTKGMSSTSTDAEYTISGDESFGMTSNQIGSSDYNNRTGKTYINWAFRRAPGFFDVVCYSGTGVARTVAHNLAAVPELMIVKSRGNTGQWLVYNKSLGGGTSPEDYVLLVNSTSAQIGPSVVYWNSTNPSSAEFTVGTNSNVNTSGNTYVAYLFASCPGVSKVGSYTGTGTTQVINCGFTSGARFIMIKRTDSTGNWYVWDSARGIVAGNDPYLWLNSTAAEVTNTDFVDPASVGFEISSTAPAEINASGGTYIFLAIA